MMSVLVVSSELSRLKLSFYVLGFEGVSNMLHRNKVHTVSGLFTFVLNSLKSVNFFMVMVFL